MSVIALLLEACRLAGVREPLEFYALSPSAQGLWLAHAKNLAEGGYGPKKPAQPSATADPRAWAAQAIEAARRRGALPKGD